MSNLIDNRQIRVFISSTFRDMQDERDYLMKRTFPKLRKLAAERDVTLTELDLRWGITEEESKSGKVVGICLREIENSIPFFIGIIGNRYGWVPKKEDLGENITERFTEVNKYIDQHLSVTEMEMQFGVLSREEDMHAYFYIKGQEEDADNPEMLNRLKEEVCKSKYPSTTYSSPEHLAVQVEEAFTFLLDELFPNGNLSELEKERIGQRSFMNQLSQNYIKDEKNFNALDAWLADGDSHQFVVTGASGLGKSALIANWIKEKLTDSSRDYNVIYHFTGNGGSESSSEHITKCIADEIKDIYGWQDNELGKPTKIDDLFLRVSAEGKKPLLIVIDAINQIVDVDNAKLLNWLPIPGKNIKILFSTLEDDLTMAVFKNRNYPIYTLEPLDTERRSQLVRSYLKLYAKSLTDAQVVRIVSDAQCENTLVLKTLMDELINFGIYEKIDERIEYYLAHDTINDFYQALLASYEGEFGYEYVKTLLSIISVAKYGLSEQEILLILDVNPLVWSQFYCSFMGQFVSKQGIISFSHNYVKEAVKSRYLNNLDGISEYRTKIIDAFAAGDTIREWEELLYQYYNLGDIKSLTELLQNLSIFTTMVKNHVHDMVLYVRAMIDNGYDPFKYKQLLFNARSERSTYGWFISFFTRYFSLYELGLSLCEDYENALANETQMSNDDESYEDLYIWKGIIHRSLSNYSDAIDSFTNSYNFCLRKYGEVHINTSLALKHIGTIYNAMKDYDKAEDYYLRALDIQKKFITKEEQIDTLRIIADNYLDKNDFIKAEDFLMKALTTTRDILGFENTAISSIYNSLSVLYDDCGKYDEAIKLFKCSIELDSKLYGKYNIQIAHTFNNLANAYCHIGNIIDAMYAYEEAINIKTKLVGEDNFDTCISIAGLGNVYKLRGEFEKAIECHNKYLIAYKNIFGENDSYLAVILAGLGSDYYEKEEYEEALDKHQEAVAILINNNDDILSSYYNAIGNDLYCIGKYAEAIDAYNKALDCYDVSSSPYTKSILLNCIAHSCACMGEYFKAKSLFEEALEIRKQMFPVEDSRVMQCIDNVQRIQKYL